MNVETILPTHLTPFCQLRDTQKPLHESIPQGEVRWLQDQSGAKRKWGTHAIARSGRRYFDEPFLLERLLAREIVR